MFSRTFAYALRAMTFIAQESNVEKKVSLDELASSIQLSQHYLGKIMQELVRKGFLHSVKGPGGGFWLDEERSDITIYVLLNAVDGDQIVNSCLMGRLKCNAKNPCPMHDEYLVCRNRLIELMKKTSIKKWKESDVG
jgi:Rrf2 family transcriptional regulator, iron-sulfur cluster assembly transcription factor